MAEGWTRFLQSANIEAYSAGVERHGLNPLAVKVMKEAGVDISTQTSSHLDEVKDIQLDVIFTLCGHAHETCPYFPSESKIVHMGFDDPPKLAKIISEQGGSLEEQLNIYRKVRDQIKDFVENLPNTLEDLMGHKRS